MISESIETETGMKEGHLSNSREMSLFSRKVNFIEGSMHANKT